MAGLSSALNIAKNALLAFQTSVQVTSHNVANVDTEGYSRQKPVSTPYPPSPSPVGPMGSGVKIDRIKRYFDAFLEANLNLKRTELGFFTAEETGMRLVEAVFNEAGDLGLATILNDFFSAWQTLSNRPEGLPERRLVVEKGKLLAENISEKFRALKDLKDNVGRKIKSLVETINRLAREISELNLQITAAESGRHQANDLRDQRDRLIAELSELVPIRYFENKDGAYNVILGRGFNLVDVDRYWKLELSGTEVYWLGHSGEKARLTSREVAGGEFGGWLRILEQISDEWNHEYVSSTKAVLRKDGNLLTEDTTFRELGLSVGDKFEFSGTDHFGNPISGAFKIESYSDLNRTVRDLLDEIERAYGFTVEVYLKDGRLFIQDGYRGGGELSFKFETSPLDFGHFDDPGLNYRVKELNLVGKLSLFAEELIRAINRLHSEGVGLEFFTGELEGVYHTADYLKNLPFFLDLNRNGSLFVWVKDPNGNITPVRVVFELPSDATLQDVADRINQSLRDFYPDEPVKAVVRNGRLVFQAREGWAFAFSNDTSGILASAGINVFFTGKDAGSIEVNELLSVHPEHVAAARLDREAWRSEEPVAGFYRSRLPITDPDSVIFNDPPHRIYVRFFDAKGNRVLHETEDGFKVRELFVTVNPGDTLRDILDKLDAIEGLRAYLDDQGHLVLSLDPNSSKPYAYFELGVETPPPADTFLQYLRSQGVWVPQYVASNGRQESTLWFTGTDLDSVTVDEGAEVTLNFTFYDAEGRKTGETSLKISDGTTLRDLVSRIDALDELRAGFTEGDHGKIFISLEDAPSGSVSFKVSVSGGDENGKLDLSSGDALEFKEVSDRQIFPGLEPLLKPRQYVADLGDLNPQELEFSGWLTIRFFDDEGHELGHKSLATYGSPDVTLSDGNGNGRIDLEDLVSALDGTAELKAYIDNGELVIALDSDAPEKTAYFVIEGNGPTQPWGTIEFINRAGTPTEKDDDYYRLSFRMGAVENWLYDRAGRPIDADTANDTVDPFRIELETGKGLVQILNQYNATENARFGLSAELDAQGRLVVKLSGLYDTRSFVITDAFRREAFSNTVSTNRFDPRTDTWFFLTDTSVDSGALFPTAPDDGSTTDPQKVQFLTLTYQDAKKNDREERRLFVRRTQTFSDPSTVTTAEDATLTFTFYDASGSSLGSVNLTVSSGTSLEDLASDIKDLTGLHAEITDDKALLIGLRTDEFPEGDPLRGAAFFTVAVNDGSGGDNILQVNIPSGSANLSFHEKARLVDYLNEVRALDADGDGVKDFSVVKDSSGRLRLAINDTDLDGDGKPDWVRFQLKSSLDSEEGNLVTYLNRRVFYDRRGFIRDLGGFDVEPGDNRNALRLADLSDEKREALGEASLYDYYTAVVGEVGIAGKRVSEARAFMEDLIKQLRLMRDSISAVSLDEEMANLMKYQQAFTAAAKLLTAADEMLMTLIEAKR